MLRKLTDEETRKIRESLMELTDVIGVAGRVFAADDTEIVVDADMQVAHLTATFSWSEPEPKPIEVDVFVSRLWPMDYRRGAATLHGVPDDLDTGDYHVTLTPKAVKTTKAVKAGLCPCCLGGDILTGENAHYYWVRCVFCSTQTSSRHSLGDAIAAWEWRAGR